MKSSPLFIFMLFFSLCTYSQDSLKLDSELNIEIRGQHILSALQDNPEAYESLSERGRVRDNPFHHFAIFSGINYTGTLNERYTFQTGLYMEERSFSGGNNSIKNLVLFPRIKLGVIDTLKIGNTYLKFKGSAGDFWDEDFSDMLRFYNMDFQALKTRFGIGRIWFGFDVIGDLSQNIGFDLHELYKFSIAYEEDNYINVASISVNELLDAQNGNHITHQDYNFSNYYRWNFKGKTSLEMQFDYRINKKMDNSIALGAKVKHKIEQFQITSALRYYSKRFNQGYASYKPSFRGENSYVGDQLYPLKNYFRPINQWALLTEHGADGVFNFELTTHWDQKIYRKLYFTSDADLNIILLDVSDKTIYYPFYNIGLKMKFLERFTMALTGTNKHMNLDTYYQTSTPSKYPFLSYAFRMDLSRIKLRTTYI